MRMFRSGSRGDTGVLLLLFGAIALALRVGVSYYAVFGRDFVAFIESDAWYHMRLVDATVRHFPHRIWFDPYLVWPGGEWVNAGPFFDWVIAGAALLVGLGAPSPRLVDVVGACAPAVIGALTGIPVYVIGRELFSRRAGLWAAFIVGVLPGQILMRSVLGFTDHHCAETLLSTTAVMWIVLALDPARPLRQRLRLSGGAGATFGCYLLTWGGGSLFVLVVVASSAASLILQRLRRETSDNLPLILAPVFTVAAVMIAPWLGTRPYFGYDLAALAGGAALLIGLRAWDVVTTSLRHDRLVYLSGLATGAGLCLLVVFLRHDGWSGLAGEIGRISPWRAAGYVREAAPLLKAEDSSPLPLWNEFSSSLLLAVLGAVSYVLRPGAITSPRGALLLTWTGVIVFATFGQVRFAYYLGVNAALFAGFAVDELLYWSDGFRWRGRPVARRVAWTVLTLAVALPAAAELRKDWGREASISSDWYDAMQWLQSNSPEPFNTDDAYYRPDRVAQGESGLAGGYGVLAWWNNGYWITRLAHRIPNANPKQTQVKEVASFLLAENPEEASRVLDGLKTRYVVVDDSLQALLPGEQTDRTAAFVNIAVWAGRAVSDYCQAFALPGQADSASMQVYCFPKYYRTMAIRLYAFGGRAVMPQRVTAISWTQEQRGHRRVSVLAGSKSFETADEADRFIASRRSEHWRIASADQLTSCVPLEALSGYAQVYRSVGHQRSKQGGIGPSTVQIYEYLDVARAQIGTAATPARGANVR